ncbi:hypothetical protein VUJ49_06920 [Pseudomonas berkeleyensis]|uniref:Uncharacterized protein n=1 Tax=Pseudomonas berkeleyensis TaxID=2726956 RepID=A0A7G5DSQ8_9PSED|nr:hypothetical protein [Pseudomonas berkeleyensis]QMV64783.1 hypothetical protein HS968_06895 [Pseudomonas berkeleyensis]WSO40252.1 hypothetical protein VUJ49_06920 [Pseudomonas berkeleyensis]
MQFQETETVTTAEPNEQIDVRERKPYQTPCLVRLDLDETEAGGLGATDAGIFS